jgi:hypothetical protein
MGDRANVKVLDGDKAIYLYTHWGGTELPSDVWLAMRRRQRWDDEAYLARIVFCQMVKGQEDGETGYGISTHLCDNDGYPILVIDCEKQEIRFESEVGELIKALTFEEFVAQAKCDWPTPGECV